MRGFLAARKRPRAAMAISFLGVMLNAGLGWSLVFGHDCPPARGAMGAGAATTLSWAAMFGVPALFLAADRRLRRFRLAGR